MSQRHHDSAKYFEELRDRVRDEVGRGHFQTGLALCDEAIDWARSYGDKDALDLALCNRGGILIAQGKDDGVGIELRKILLGSTSQTNSFLAAYNLSRFHELRRETERGLFYARLCLGHAEKTGNQDYMALGYNQVGSLQLINCDFDEACSSYEQALALSSLERSTDRAIMMSNIGYCRVVLGHHRRGFQWLFTSLRQMRRLEARVWEMLPRLGLSYAYLEIHKLDLARRHAVRALALAEAADCKEHVMNSLYLLGEAEKMVGNELAAYEHFNRLQKEFYPDKPFIPDFLMATDIRKLINLMA